MPLVGQEDRGSAHAEQGVLQIKSGHACPTGTKRAEGCEVRPRNMPELAEGGQESPRWYRYGSNTAVKPGIFIDYDVLLPRYDRIVPAVRRRTTTASRITRLVVVERRNNRSKTNRMFRARCRITW